MTYSNGAIRNASIRLNGAGLFVSSLLLISNVKTRTRRKSQVLGLLVSAISSMSKNDSLKSIVLWAKKARYSSVAFSSTSE
jgi:hypothetical protein